MLCRSMLEFEIEAIRFNKQYGGVYCDVGCYVGSYIWYNVGYDIGLVQCKRSIRAGIGGRGVGAGGRVRQG